MIAAVDDDLPGGRSAQPMIGHLTSSRLATNRNGGGTVRMSARISKMLAWFAQMT